MSDERRIALHANQVYKFTDWTGHKKRINAYILLTEDECERLENALRLARTSKLGVEHRAVTRTEDVYGYGNVRDNPVIGTTFIAKGFRP